MPQPKPIPSTLRKALMKLFKPLSLLCNRNSRIKFILVGSSASTAHNSTLYTKDVDILAPKLAIQDIGRRILDGAGDFPESADNQIAYETAKGIRIPVEIIQTGTAIKVLLVQKLTYCAFGQ